MNIKGGFHYSLYSLSLRWGLMDTKAEWPAQFFNEENYPQGLSQLLFKQNDDQWLIQ